MTGFPSEVDIAVIGAGAAGIGAARRLVEAGGAYGAGAGGARPRRRPGPHHRAGRLSARSRRRVAAFRRSQPAVADRPGPRLLGPSPTAGMDDPAVAQRRERRGRSRLACHPRSARPGAAEGSGGTGATARWRACSSPAAAGTSCSMRPAPGGTAPNSTASRSRTMSATTRAAPISTGALGEGYGRLFEKLAEGLPVALETPVYADRPSRAHNPA